jgi:hypothetical protein
MSDAPEQHPVLAPEPSLPMELPSAKKNWWNRNVVLVGAILAVAIVAALAGAVLAGDDDEDSPATTIAGSRGAGAGSKVGAGQGDPSADDGSGGGIGSPAPTDSNGVPVTTVPHGAMPTETGPGSPPASSPAPEPTMPTGTTAPTPGGAVSAVVDGSSSRWDNDPCNTAANRASRPYFSAPPSDACAVPAGYIAGGTRVQLVCATSGATVTDAQGNSSSRWARLGENNSGLVSYMNTLSFTAWATIDSQLPGC